MKRQNLFNIPTAGWHKGNLAGYAVPTAGTAAALIELYRVKSGGRDAETGVIWNRAEKFVHFSSNRGPDIVAVLKRIGDEGILAFMPPISLEDDLLMCIKTERTRRAWAVVKVLRAGGEDEDEESDSDDLAADACDEPEDEESNEDG
jgi:hypothetical protein